MTDRSSLSLRTLLLAGMAVVVAVSAAVAVVVTQTTRARLVDQLDSRLDQAAGADRGRQLFIKPLAEEGWDGFRSDDGGRPERQSDLYEGLVLADGELVTVFAPNTGGETLGPPEIDDATLAAVTDRATLTLPVAGSAERYRVLARRLDDAVFLTALPLTEVEHTVSRLILVQLLGFLAVLTVLGAVTWWVLTLGIQPIRRMTDTASDIAAGDQIVRIPENTGGAEATRLAAALNRMLARIDSALDERGRSEERLRQFVADASHELRTPVTTIQGYAQLYRAGGLADRDALNDAMRRTESEATRMARLVAEMLSLAKLDEERPLDRAPVDLARLARDAASDTAAVQPGRSIDVDADAAVVVDGDDDRLRQVLGNLMSNALIHTDATAAITVTATSEGAMGVLTVGDSGVGMAPEVVARVTERFFRADRSRSRAQGGSGLGLAIADAVASAHGGALDITSSPGDGTTVRLRIPLTQAPLAG